MTEKTVQVGDVVPWREVRPGSLVRQGAGDYALRVGDQHHWVRLANTIKMDWARVGTCGGWLTDDGEDIDEGPVTIVALGLTGQETAAELQRLAEVYEVREALQVYRPDTHADWCAAVEHEWPPSRSNVVARGRTADEARQAAAEGLHAAGWRPGMTAEDAARLLSTQEAT